MEVVYYVATSLDGYIATAAGGVEWLEPFQKSGVDHGFKEFYSSIDSLVMGSKTYEFSLKHPPWMAADRPSWVFTRRDLEVAHPTVTLTSQEPPVVMEEIEGRGLKRVWLLGGGKLATSFRRHGLLTHALVAIVPVVLGGGIPLFAPDASRPDTDQRDPVKTGERQPALKQDDLELLDVTQFPTGIVLLSYKSVASA